MSKQVVTRFAPSPTGQLHVGGLRSALYNWLYAKQHNGEFILRIEDTDRERYVEGAEQGIFESLAWAGLDIDGQPIKQSERKDIHVKYAKQLVEAGQAYYCFCAPEELDKMRQEQQARKERPGYDGRCRKLTREEVALRQAQGDKSVIRLKTPDSGETVVEDMVHGQVRFKNSELDDPVILKSDGYPTYHLAHIIDDHESGVSHVIRGDEWLPSLPKHVLLYQALGWELPVFAHLPLILAQDKSKLSKRHGVVSVLEFREKGYLAEALLNYVLLLGWHPKKGSEQEIFSRTEMLEQFKLADVQKSGAIFDYQKLAWLNAEYLRRALPVDLVTAGQALSLPVFKQPDIDQAVRLEQSRVKTLVELSEALQFIYEEIDYEPAILVWKKSDQTSAANRLTMLIELLASVSQADWSEENLEKIIKDKIETEDLGKGDTLWPLRVALSGQQNSPGPFEIAAVLGREKSLARVQKAVEKLGKM